MFPALPEKSPKFNSSSTPVPTNLRLSGGRRLFFLKRQFNLGPKNLAKRIENLNLALLSVRYPSRRTNDGCCSWLDRIKWLFMYVFTVLSNSR